MKAPMARASARPAARRSRRSSAVAADAESITAMEEKWIPDQVRDDDLSGTAQFVT